MITKEEGETMFACPTCRSIETRRMASRLDRTCMVQSIKSKITIRSERISINMMFLALCVMSSHAQLRS